MADTWDEASGECGDDAVVVEITLGLLDLLLVQQTHLAPLAIRELIDDRTADVERNKVIDGGTNVGTNGGEEDDQPHVELSAGSMISRGGDDEFGGYRHDGALEEHQKQNRSVVEIT